MSGVNGVNLRGVVRGAVTALHPDEDVILYVSSWQGNRLGKSTATYFPPVIVGAQIQSEDKGAVYHANNAAQTEIVKKFYLFAPAVADSPPAGLLRPWGRSGDLIQRIRDGSWWQITEVAEDFSTVGWVSVRATLQTRAQNPEVSVP